MWILVSGLHRRHGPPDGGRPAFRLASINMALLTEGADVLAFALHGIHAHSFF